MLAEGTFIAVPDLLVPDQTKLVRLQAGDDIIVAVAVNVVSEHVRSAESRERVGMKLPLRVAVERFRLLIPAILHQDVEPLVAVHVADTQSMTKRLGRGWLGNSVKRPRLQRILPINCGISPIPV